MATPISLGRAGYWLGLAHERAGDAGGGPERLRAWARSTRRASTASSPPRSWRARRTPRLAGGGAAPDWRDGAVHAPPRWCKAACFLHLADDDAAGVAVPAPRRRGPAAGDPGGAGADGDRPRAAADRHPHRQGRRGRGDRSCPTSTIRCTPIAEEDWPVPTEYALAIARQESEFDAAAASSAGARGLMQLMPATAEAHGRERGAALQPGAAGSDPLYNARLGTALPRADARPLRRLLRARHRRLQRRAGPGGPVAGGRTATRARPASTR